MMWNDTFCPQLFLFSIYLYFCSEMPGFKQEPLFHIFHWTSESCQNRSLFINSKFVKCFFSIKDSYFLSNFRTSSERCSHSCSILHWLQQINWETLYPCGQNKSMHWFGHFQPVQNSFNVEFHYMYMRLYCPTVFVRTMNYYWNFL